MSSVLFSESLLPFYDIVLSLPTVFFTFLLLVSIVLWTLTIIGIIGLDSIEIDIAPTDGSSAESSMGQVLGGLLGKLGLAGVPITITVSLASLIGWLISYYLSYYLLSILPVGLVKTLVSLPVLVLLLVISLVISSIVLNPFKKFFVQTEQKTLNKVIGQTAVVRTSRVDSHYGEALLDDSGAGLILKVRCFDEQKINLGDKVVILDYLEQENAYHVILESEFNR